MAQKNKEFGKRLDRYIQKAGLTKKKLSDMIGVSSSTVLNYVNEGRFPEAPILLKISQTLNVPVEELLTGKTAESVELDSFNEHMKFAELIDAALKKNNIALSYQKKKKLLQLVFEAYLKDKTQDKKTITEQAIKLAKLAQ